MHAQWGPRQLELPSSPKAANLAIQLRCQAHEQLTPRMVSGTVPGAGIQLPSLVSITSPYWGTAGTYGVPLP